MDELKHWMYETIEVNINGKIVLFDNITDNAFLPVDIQSGYSTDMVDDYGYDYSPEANLIESATDGTLPYHANDHVDASVSRRVHADAESTSIHCLKRR